MGGGRHVVFTDVGAFDLILRQAFQRNLPARLFNRDVKFPMPRFAPLALAEHQIAFLPGAGRQNLFLKGAGRQRRLDPPSGGVDARRLAVSRVADGVLVEMDDGVCEFERRELNFVVFEELDRKSVV